MEFITIELVSSHIEELQSFYRDQLGLPVHATTPATSGHDVLNKPTAESGQDSAARARGSRSNTVWGSDSGLTVQVGATSLHFTRSAGTEAVYHIAFNIPDNKIGRALEWLMPRVQLLPHFRSGQTLIDWPDWNAQSIYFLDAAGNILEVIARHELHNPADGPFGPRDFLNVSELGLVVPEPHATMELLKRTFGLATKSVLPDFGAVGDDHGLFIVSAEERPWMPTDDRRAQRYPARAVVRHTQDAELNIPDTAYTIVGTRA